MGEKPTMPDIPEKQSPAKEPPKPETPATGHPVDNWTPEDHLLHGG